MGDVSLLPLLLLSSANVLLSAALFVAVKR